MHSNLAIASHRKLCCHVYDRPQTIAYLKSICGERWMVHSRHTLA